MAKFSLQFPASDIEALAARYSYRDDRAVLAAGAAARKRGYFTRDEFLAVCAWKTGRSKRRVRTNGAAAVEEATRRALAATDEAERMNALTSLGGVGVPTGSTLLFAAEPERYPILDRRALESLGRRPRGVYPVGFWLSYLGACRALAAEHGLAQRTLDKALWQHSYERSRRARRAHRRCEHQATAAQAPPPARA